MTSSLALRRLFLTTSFLALAAPALAHADDAGDIHPAVRIEDRQFAVYFRNTTDKQTYKTVVAADGRLLALSARATAALTASQRATIAESATLLPLSIPTIELAGGSVRCMLAGVHLTPR